MRHHYNYNSPEQFCRKKVIFVSFDIWTSLRSAASNSLLKRHGDFATQDCRTRRRKEN